MTFDPTHPRGFLQNYPDDVIAVINGQPITKADKLWAKRERQERQLATRRRNYETAQRPCFIWVFKVETFPYEGWWLYVKTLKNSWGLDFQRFDRELILKIMRLWPCGYLPIIENFGLWKREFAKVYHRETSKRQLNQGMVIAMAEIDYLGRLVDVQQI